MSKKRRTRGHRGPIVRTTRTGQKHQSPYPSARPTRWLRHSRVLQPIRRLWSASQHRARILAPSLMGACLLLFAAYVVLSVTPSPRDEPMLDDRIPSSVAMYLKMPFRSTFSVEQPAFNIKVALDARAGWIGCGKADVVVRFDPRRTFWRMANLSEPTPFAIVIESRATEGFGIEPTGLSPADLDLLPVGIFRQIVGTQPQIVLGRVYGADRVSIFTGEVRHWTQDDAPLAFHFRASWLSRRGFGSCNLHIPRVMSTGVREQDIQGAFRFPRHSLRQVWQATGRVSVEPRVRGRILDEEASQPPSSASYLGRTWECGYESQPPDKQEQSPLDEIPGVPVGRAFTECHSVVPITTSSLQTWQTLILIVIGALLALVLERMLAAIHP